MAAAEGASGSKRYLGHHRECPLLADFVEKVVESELLGPGRTHSRENRQSGWSGRPGVSGPAF
jgi:hypothetical protein